MNDCVIYLLSSAPNTPTSSTTSIFKKIFGKWRIFTYRAQLDLGAMTGLWPS